MEVEAEVDMLKGCGKKLEEVVELVQLMQSELDE